MRSGYLKTYDQVLIKVGRLKQQYSWISPLYEVKVLRSEAKHAQSVTDTKLPAPPHRI